MKCLDGTKWEGDKNRTGSRMIMGEDTKNVITVNTRKNKKSLMLMRRFPMSDM